MANGIPAAVVLAGTHFASAPGTYFAGGQSATHLVGLPSGSLYTHSGSTGISQFHDDEKNSMNATGSLHWMWTAGLGCLLLSIAGCQQELQGTFAYRSKVAQLPEKHQEQLKQYLTLYFGTASSPRRMLPQEDAEVGEDGQVPLVEGVERNRLRHGQRVYNRNCAPCHSVTGDGLGPATGPDSMGEHNLLDPKPRDYRLGKFKFASTPRGYKPRRMDLVRTIRYGAKGTSMPTFRWMPDEDIHPLIDYVITLSQRGELELRLLEESEFELEPEDDYDPQVVADYVTEIEQSWRDAEDHVVHPLTPRPAYTDASILLGRRAFLTRGCAKCHGNDGRGNRQLDVGKDDWGNVAYAADLTSGMLHGGRRPIDVYRRIFSGINGTPMPGFGDALAEEPETIWHLVHYILSIVEGRDVEGLDQIQPPPPVTADQPAEGVGVPGRSATVARTSPFSAIPSSTSSSTR